MSNAEYHEQEKASENISLAKRWFNTKIETQNVLSEEKGATYGYRFEKILGNGNFGLVFAVKRISRKTGKLLAKELALKVQICAITHDSLDKKVPIVKASPELRTVRWRNNRNVNDQIKKQKGILSVEDIRDMLEGYEFHKESFRSVYEEIGINRNIKAIKTETKKEAHRNLVIGKKTWFEIPNSKKGEFKTDESGNTYVTAPKEIAIFLLMDRAKCNLKDYMDEIINENEERRFQIMTDEQRWRYILDMINGIDLLHSNGIVHSDLHNENIYIMGNNEEDSEPICVLGDFGRGGKAKSKFEGYDQNVYTMGAILLKPRHLDIFNFLKLTIYMMEKESLVRKELASRAGCLNLVLDLFASYTTDQEMKEWEMKNINNPSMLMTKYKEFPLKRTCTIPGAGMLYAVIRERVKKNYFALTSNDLKQVIKQIISIYYGNINRTLDYVNFNTYAEDTIKSFGVSLSAAKEKIKKAKQENKKMRNHLVKTLKLLEKEKEEKKRKLMRTVYVMKKARILDSVICSTLGITMDELIGMEMDPGKSD